MHSRSLRFQSARMLCKGSFSQSCTQESFPVSATTRHVVNWKIYRNLRSDTHYILSLMNLACRFRHNVDMAKKDSEKRTTQFLDRGPGSGSKSIARLYPPRPAVHPPRPAPSSSSSSSTTPRMVHGQQKTRHGNNDPSSGQYAGRNIYFYQEQIFQRIYM